MGPNQKEAEELMQKLLVITESENSRAPGLRKCPACFKQFKQKAFFIEHMQKAGHSPHEPKCAHCGKHCRCLDALREHLSGRLAKKDCASEFAKKGCSLCLEMFESPDVLAEHLSSCQLTAATNSIHMVSGATNAQKRIQAPKDFVADLSNRRPAVALDCEMVGGGEDGSVDLCARVCIVDEDENVLLNMYVKPELPVTDYRFELTGVHPEDLDKAMPIKAARKAVEEILFNGVKYGAGYQNANLLVGHSLCHDLGCLEIKFPIHLQRDTAYYPPLTRTSNVSNKLKYLTSTYLGYKIQEGTAHDPCEDAIAAMRLYKKMKRANHIHVCAKTGEVSLSGAKSEESAESWSAEEFLGLSKPRYKCWCLDR